MRMKAGLVKLVVHEERYSVEEITHEGRGVNLLRKGEELSIVTPHVDVAVVLLEVVEGGGCDEDGNDDDHEDGNRKEMRKRMGMRIG